MRTLLSLLALVAVMSHQALAGTEQRENAVMENEYLRVEVDPLNGSFAVRPAGSDKEVVQDAAFARPIDAIAATAEVRDTVWGQGEQIVIRHQGGWMTTLRLFRGQPFLQIHTTTHNGGREPTVTASLELLDFQVALGPPPEQLRSFGTGFLTTLDEAAGSFSFTSIVDPATRNGVVAACLTHERGSGVFFTELDQGKVRVKTRIDFGRYQVEPGRSRDTETLLIGYFDDARLGLEAYADAVVKHYGIELPPIPAVYCTWYHGRASNEARFYENAQFGEQYLKPFGLSVMQIDDGWQERFPSSEEFDRTKQWDKGPGPVKVFIEANDNYPHGMEFTAERVGKLGLKPGIWFMPFAGDHFNPYFADKQDLFAHWPDGSPAADERWSGSLLDLSNKNTQKFVYDRTKRIYDWGYRYFKLDGMHTGAVTHNVYVNTGWRRSGWQNSPNFVGTQQAPGKSSSTAPSTALADPNATHIEAYRIGLKTIRRAAPEAFILGCNVSQNMRSMGAAFDLIDAMRIGPDNGGAARGQWNGVLVGARHGSNLYFLNGRVWHNDPDPVYVRPSNPLNAARMMVSWVAVTGSMVTTSYQFSELPPERLELLKRCMPSHGAVARPVDLFESDPPKIWLTTDTRRNVRRDVIGLFNWRETEPHEIDYEMGKLGLDPQTAYAAFDYWAGAFVEPIQGTLRQTLPPGTCRILAVRPVADHPQLLSTSRHVTQGIVDVLEERWDARTRTLSGRSRVVGNDPYELRVALPASGSWKVARLSADDVSIELGEATAHGVRLRIESSSSREVSWQVSF